MKGKLLRDLAIIVAVFGGIWAVVALIDLSPKEPITILSTEKEKELGDKLIEQYLDGETIVEDSLVIEAMDTLTGRLLSTLDSTAYDYTFHVVESSQINAFATLGGNIVVFSGLIAQTESPEELASVLAHEIGHIEERHVVNRLVREFGVAVLLGVLTGGDVVVLQEVTRTMVSSAFDRNQEDSADDFALETMEKAGINPHYLGTFFNRLREKYETDEYQKYTEFISTHPTDKSRVENAFLYETDSTFVEKPFDLPWQEIRGACGWVEAQE